MNREWMLLIYSIPSDPTRYRAAIWRELKRVGAILLRDGVHLLPRRPDLEKTLHDLGPRVEEYGGTADIVPSMSFRPEREAVLIEKFRHERSDEYREVYHGCVRFLRDVLEDVDADDFGFPDVGKLESELKRLEKWREQIDSRNYFGAEGEERVAEIMDKCARAFDHFVSTASEREDARASRAELATDDVFERLGGPKGEPEEVPEGFPL